MFGSSSISNTNSNVKPKFIYDGQNMNVKINEAYQCKRDKKLFGLYTHTDSLFCSDEICFGVSFHKDKHRFNFGQFDLNKAKNYYYECSEFKVNREIPIREIFRAAEEVGEKPYLILKNNCNDSARQLAKKCNFEYHRKVPVLVLGERSGIYENNQISMLQCCYLIQYKIHQFQNNYL